ncbi:MAG: hypothetical protein C5B54_11350 [Acidobacteria bacterium]|nr:MAG: hypothetical protein C5B54_11350 [Acidobacteriota bacterium]
MSGRMAIDLLPQKTAARKIFRIPLTLHSKQAEIDASPARFKIIRAGRKFGKTTYAQYKALKRLGRPNSIHWHIAPTYKQAKLISWNDFKRLIPPESLHKKPNDVDLTIRLKNGSQLFLMGSDEPDSLRGPAPTSITLEESAYHKREAWYEVLRPNLIPSQAPCDFIFTPKGFNWMKDVEDEAHRRIAQGIKDWACFHYTIYDNPFLSKEEIEEAKKDCDSDVVWRQEYLAEYESSVGRVFASFDGDYNGRHIQKIILPHGLFDVYRAIDWGMRDNTACLWAYIQNRRLFVYREHLANNLSAPAQAQVIRNQTSSSERVQRNAISHDAAKEDPAMRGLTVLWHFRQAGITPLQISTRDKKHSRAMINQLIQENRLVIDSEKCPKLRKQLLAYEWKDTTMEKPDEMADDDAVDALHYLVEMLQFDLFMDRKKDDVVSREQMYAEIAKERLAAWRNPRMTISHAFDASGDNGLAVDDTAAGYI